MSRPVLLTKPVAALPLTEWERLDEIFLQARKKFGSTTLAVGDMLRALQKGQLKAAACKEQTGEWFLLRSVFWQHHILRDELSLATPPTVAGVSVWRKEARGFRRIRGYVYFGYRPDFEKLYPPSATVAAEQPIDQPERERRTPGRKRTKDWPDHVAAWLIKVARDDPDSLGNIQALAEDARTFLEKKLKWAPQEQRDIERVIASLLRYIK